MEIDIQKAGKPYLFRYRPDNDFTIDEIKNNYIFFSNVNNLNDPLDGNYKMLNPVLQEEKYSDYIQFFIDTLGKNASFYKESIAYLKTNYPDVTSIEKLVSQNIHGYINKFGIACFSVACNNFMLWAHYTNNHQGVCIQYNTELDQDFFDELYPIVYVNEFPKIDFNIEDGFQPFRKMFYTKLKMWEREYEIRLLKEKSGRYIVRPEAIRSIVFGLKAKKDFKNRIIEAVKECQQHIEIYDSELMKNGSGLTLLKY